MIEPIIIAETNDYFVINKPADMAVEPLDSSSKFRVTSSQLRGDSARGKPPSNKRTLRDWLINNNYLNPADWQEDERCGVVHRLDTDTSGVMLWAKTPESQKNLKLMWQGRQVKKTYVAMVVGECEPSGEIDLPISRDNKKDRQQVDLLKTDRSRPALTTYKRLKVGEIDGQKVSLVEAHPVTGRTHQIRVHLKAIGHIIIGDELYGDKLTRELAKKLGLTRQFLHAQKICLPDEICYEAPLPDELNKILKIVF